VAESEIPGAAGEAIHQGPRRRRLAFALNRRRPAARASRLVAFMKLLLPATALAIVALTFAWPQLLPDQREIRIGDAKMAGVNVDGLVMDNPRFVGTDSQQRPYQITAASASQRGKADQLVYLDRPKADILMKSSGWVAMASRKGVYDKLAETVDLSGGVTLFYDRGYQFASESARVDLRAGTAEGRQPVMGHGEGGRIEGEGFQLFDRGARIIFTGRSKAVLRGARRKPS
jgi:lipopolysaccharide export system protein LptC